MNLKREVTISKYYRITIPVFLHKIKIIRIYWLTQKLKSGEMDKSFSG